MTNGTPRYKGYIFDLDGTVYLGERIIEGARERIAWLRKAGCRTVFLSNKPVESRAKYAATLTRLGIPTPVEDVINSTQAMFTCLRQQQQYEGLYVIGEPALRQEFLQEGFNLAENVADIAVVIAALDRTLDYAKLNTAHQALVRGARFWATNGDRTCPIDGGEIPDCAGVIAFLEATTGRQVELVAGKPARAILDAAVARLGVGMGDCLMTGDRLETDMLMGRRAGMDTALVLTGVTSRQALEASEIKPTYVLQSIADVP